MKTGFSNDIRGAVHGFGFQLRSEHEAESLLRLSAAPPLSDVRPRMPVELRTTAAVYESCSDEAKIMTARKEGMLFFSAETADRVVYSKRNVLRLINDLMEKNDVLVLGGGRGTKYRLR